MALKYNPATGKVEDDGNSQVPVADDAIQRLTTGVMGLPVALGRDLVNQVGTRVSNAGRGLVGAEQAPLPGLQRTSELAGVVGAAAQDFGQMNSNLAASIRSGLGLTAAGVPTAQPEGPIVPPLSTPPTDTVLSPLPVAPTVQSPAPVTQAAAPVPRALAPVPTEVQSVQQLDVRAPTQDAGLTFGFGGGGETARQYLDRMDVVDQQRAQSKQLQQTNNKIGWATQELGRDNATIGERSAARQQLAALQPMALGLTQAAGAQTAQQLGDNAALQRTQLEADANANAAALQAQTQLGVAGVGAEATLGAAGVRANATQQAALTKAVLAQNSPESQLSGARAELLRIQQGLAQNALANGDVSGALQAVSGGAPSALRLLEDDFGNALGTVDAQGNTILYSDDQLKRNRAASQVAKGFGLQ